VSEQRFVPGRSTPRNVLLINHNPRGVGTFYRCWHLARNLARIGLTISLLTVSPNRRVLPLSESKEDVRLVETPNLLTNMYALGGGYGAIGIPYRISYALRHRFDLVHAFDHKPNVLLPAMFAHNMKNTPLVADWSDWWGKTGDGSGLQEGKARLVVKLETATEEYIHRRADRVTTISTGLRQRAISLGIPSEKTCWIPSGAPDDLILPRDRTQCRQELGIPSSTFLLGHVGFGIEDLSMSVPALLMLGRKRRNVRLGIIGPSGPEGSLGDAEFRRAVVRFGRVPFHKLAPYLGACDAFILPLKDSVVNRTRWPNKFGDYIAAGRPVLTSPIGDVAQFVESADCGIVWRSSSDLVAAVERLMDTPREASEMGRRARSLAEGDLSWATLAKRFMDVYRDTFASNN